MLIKRITIFIIFGLLTANLAHGATKYVDGNLSSNCTSGNYSIATRSCNGSDGNAYSTVKAGIAAMSAGDTLNIRSGAYTENSIALYFQSGTTTIQAYGSESVTIRNDYMPTTINDGKATFNTTSAGTVIFKNLNFTGLRGTVDEDYSACAIWADNGYIQIDNCEFSGFAHAGVKGRSRYWIKNSYFHDIGTDAHDHHIYVLGRRSAGNETMIEYNRFGDIYGAAIHMYGQPSYFIIRYNVIMGGPHANWGILFGGDHSKVYNNVIYNSHWGLYFWKADCHDNEVKNNLLAGNSAADVVVDYGGSSYPINNTVTYNFYGSSSSCISCFNYKPQGDDYSTYNSTSFPYNNIRNTNNQFIASSPWAWTDLRLASNSVCINAGVNLGTANQNGLNPNKTSWPPTTVNQSTQGSGWEIGAFVFVDGGSDTTPPAPPKSLSVY